jgi:hypothetical protein
MNTLIESLRNLFKKPVTSFYLAGISSTIWFLIRVIPKPSRATYPCMRAAAPFMSAFIIYLIGIWGSALLNRAKKNFGIEEILNGFVF